MSKAPLPTSRKVLEWMLEWACTQPIEDSWNVANAVKSALQAQGGIHEESTLARRVSLMELSKAVGSRELLCDSDYVEEAIQLFETSMGSAHSLGDVGFCTFSMFKVQALIEHAKAGMKRAPFTQLVDKWLSSEGLPKGRVALIEKQRNGVKEYHVNRKMKTKAAAAKAFEQSPGWEGFQMGFVNYLDHVAAQLGLGEPELERQARMFAMQTTKRGSRPPAAAKDEDETTDEETVPEAEAVQPVKSTSKARKSGRGKTRQKVPKAAAVSSPSSSSSSSSSSSLTARASRARSGNAKGSAAVQRLEQRMAHLKETVDDPLAASLSLASQAKVPSTAKGGRSKRTRSVAAAFEAAVAENPQAQPKPKRRKSPSPAGANRKKADRRRRLDEEDVSAEKVEWTDEIGLEEGLSQSDDEEDEGNSSIVLGQVPKDEQIALSPRLKGFSSRQKGKKTKRSRGKRTPVSGPRERVRWSDAEEKCLLAHVAKIPHGTKKKWETILKRGKGVFQDFRTAGDLKDKWRNIEKKAERNSQGRSRK